MSEAAEGRAGLEILTDLLELTRSMLLKRQDANFLLESVDQRRLFMDEYDAFALQHPQEAVRIASAPETKAVLEDIISMDVSIRKALEQHKADAKADVANSTSQQKVLGYVANAISSTGSYMDYKK